jgi:hypothetical protein
MRTIAAWTAAVLLAAAAGCGDGKETVAVAPAGGGGTPAPAAGGAPLPGGLRLAAAPAGAVGVGALKKTAKEGDEVVLRARVGGSESPFVQGRASMVVADLEAVTSCADMPGDDHCPTPWDYCCEPKDKLLANTATVQVSGPDGRPLAADLRSLEGLAPLKVVVVKGVVAARPDPAVLVVDAKGIFIE